MASNAQSGRQYESQQTHYLRVSKAFGDLTSGTSFSVGWLPPRAVVIYGGVVVQTAFDSGTSDTLDIGFENANDGTTDDPNEYATLLDLTTAGFIEMDELATAGDLFTAEGAEVTATWTGTGTAPTAGEIHVIVEFIPDNDGDTSA